VVSWSGLHRGAIQNHDSEIGPAAASEIDSEYGHVSSIRSWARKERGSCGAVPARNRIWDGSEEAPELESAEKSRRWRAGCGVEAGAGPGTVKAEELDCTFRILINKHVAILCRLQ